MIDPAAFDVPAIYGPMTGLDDLLVHSTPHPIGRVWSDDPHVFERMWFSGYSPSADLLIVAGIGFYPNLDTCDAYAIINHRGIHTTVRGHRRLGRNRLDMSAGPLRFEMVEPFAQWRLTLDDNDWGVTFEIDWFETMQTMYRDRCDDADHKSEGRVAPRARSGYESFGRLAGWVDVRGERQELTSAGFVGARDHHWGTRETVGGRELAVDGPLFRHAHSGEFVAFSDFAIFGTTLYYPKGEERASASLSKAEWRLRFDQDTRMALGGEASVVFDNGVEKNYSFERLGNQVAHLRCGMYGGLGGKGGTPVGDIWHGQYVGDNAVTGETYDVNDPEVQQEITGLDDCLARFECDGEVAYGIMETVNTFSWDAAHARTHNISLLE